MKFILLPVKEPAQSKQRLSPFLSAEERERLAWSLFQDMITALTKTRLADRIALVSSNPQILEAGAELGWELIEESAQCSESRSVDLACAELISRGASEVLRIPGDIPLVRAEDIDQLFQTGMGERRAVIVPSRDGTGTNALLRNPPDAFPCRFGPDSFFKHQSEAEQSGVRLISVENPRIALDVDESDDLLLVRRLGPETATARMSATFWSLRKRLTKA